MEEHEFAWGAGREPHRTPAHVDRRNVGHQPLRELGEYKVPVRLTTDLIPQVKVVIHREGETLKAAAPVAAAPAPAAAEAAPAPAAEATEPTEAPAAPVAEATEAVTE